ncbi:hypothetical protein [Aurantimonas sp. Leaf443]|uniref:hypothetical protein n=1 Tax=Aurantimonas sp. Leaf443 TaxID=1736378 RepID=UPI0006F92A4D|nr:hypothetical protein [Aurantimonas sp. Leaf443]KQT82197.1 hypothetical protein ASG48_16305 [Aurantimonas sp. Leaf443]
MTDDRSPKTPPDAPPASGGLLSNVIRRTDNDFHGRRNGEDLIGRDIPVEEQDREAEEEEEEKER